MGLELDIHTPLEGFTLAPSFETESSRLALFGASGSGKSLTLEAVAGLLTPERGYIRTNGAPLFDSEKGVNLKPQQRRIGYVAQGYHLFPHLTALQNVAYSFRDKRVGREKALSWLEQMELTSFASRYPHELSGGQQQRVALARALASEPRLLLLDEPFAALDDLVRATLRRRVSDLLSHLDVPLVLVTHDLSEATMLADTLAIYEAGRVVQLGSAETVMHTPVSPSVAKLVGMSNLLEVQPLEDVWVRWGEEVLTLAHPASTSLLGIRPERVRVLANKQVDVETQQDNVLRVILVQTSLQGRDALLTFQAPGCGPVEVIRPETEVRRLGLEVGQSVHLSLPKDDLHPF